MSTYFSFQFYEYIFIKNYFRKTAYKRLQKNHVILSLNFFFFLFFFPIFSRKVQAS